eukprot:jgi/Psemu1/29558/gm1.29558_g
MPRKPVFNLEDWMKNISKFSMCFSMCNKILNDRKNIPNDRKRKMLPEEGEV